MNDQEKHIDVEISNTHTFAWDGFSLRIPSSWNLSFYHFGKNESRVEIQDDFALRLQLDWMRSERKLNDIRIRERYENICAKLEKSSNAVEKINAPAGWHASLIILPEKRSFVAALYLSPDDNFFALLRIFFEKTGKKQPLAIFKLVADTFQLHHGALIPWEVYDVRWQINRQFKLAMTDFKAGNKFFQFQWKKRRLMMWHISMARWIMEHKNYVEWAIEYLSKIRSIEGVKFIIQSGNKIACVRKKYRFPLGHFEDIVRFCYKYRAFVKHDVRSNNLLIVLYHYRKEGDITMVGGEIAEELKKTPFPS